MAKLQLCWRLRKIKSYSSKCNLYLTNFFRTFCFLHTMRESDLFSLHNKGGYSSRRQSGRDKYGPPVRTEYRLIVENLSSRCSWQDLKVRTNVTMLV